MNDVKKSSLFSWLLFDLANTVYAFVIPGLYFSVWLVTEQGWTDQERLNSSRRTNGTNEDDVEYPVDACRYHPCITRSVYARIDSYRTK